jgi:hypothetical protein
MGEIVGINIIKGVGALFLVFIICFMANIFVSVAMKTHTPNMVVVFAWVGTAPAMFYSGTGFWRRFAASLLGSIASMAARLGFALLTGALLSTGALTETQSLLVIFGPFAIVATIGQYAVAYFVARAIVKWGAKQRSLAAA